jgi:hypothetical protein
MTLVAALCMSERETLICLARAAMTSVGALSRSFKVTAGNSQSVTANKRQRLLASVTRTDSLSDLCTFSAARLT